MTFPWKKILCPTDFSDPSRAALAGAVEIAKHFDAEIVLLHAYQLPGYTLPEGSIVPSGKMMQELSDRADAHLGEWRRLASEMGARRVEAQKAIGEPAAEIVEAARALGADVIVVGTHGRTGLSHALLGSTAEQIVRRAACPVLTIRAGA